MKLWEIMGATIILLLLISWCSYTEASQYIPVAEPDGYHIDARDALSTNLTAVQCLALNIYHEARGEPLRGQEAVAQVTINRVISRHYPNSICGVVLQSFQFSWTHDGKSDQPRDLREWKLAYNLAYRFIHGGYWVEWMSGVTHYHRHDVRVYWPRLEVVFAIGDHVFYVARRWYDTHRRRNTGAKGHCWPSVYRYCSRRGDR